MIMICGIMARRAIDIQATSIFYTGSDRLISCIHIDIVLIVKRPPHILGAKSISIASDCKLPSKKECEFIQRPLYLRTLLFFSHSSVGARKEEILLYGESF